MAIIDRILVPTDFSELSEWSYSLAATIAKRTEGIVDLIHVIPNSVLIDELRRADDAIESKPNFRGELYPKILSEAETKLQSLLKDHFDHKVRGQTFVKVDRSPGLTIADHAWNGNYSMVIMNAKGKHESRFLRGSTSEQVVRKCKVPVLTLSSHPDQLKEGRIVIPTDGSLLSMAAVPVAVRLASIFKAHITFLYVHEVFGLFGESVPDASDDIQSRRTNEFIMDRLMDYLDTIDHDDLQVMDSPSAGISALIYDNDEIPVSFDVVSGLSAHHEITEYAGELADLVIMTTHGRSGMAHLLLGSHAEKVALNADTSVLTIRPGSKLFEKQKEKMSDL
jgi:nucleotide-binding universal stress UspA family protein